ncbi:MAG: UDP-N-acetylmuramate dehydrogenase [Chloroflexi bacterium]|nr:UDP-N-acetylmuramate dehydrogenase [Chloroflexota bacterium]
MRSKFGDRLRTSEPLSRYTSARIGGPAEFLIVAESAGELAEAVTEGWRLQAPFFILGGGSNMLVADAGARGLVIVNRAKNVQFRDEGSGVSVWAESGCSIGTLARQCVLKGYSGLEWAATVPGTVGGAVFGNAGAHGGDTASCLRVAEILHPDGTIRKYTAEELGFGYRTSVLKKESRKKGEGSGVVIAAEFGLTKDDPSKLQARVEEFVAHRKRTQPPGASIGSMFKNPPGDYAGRLIEAAGLKGVRRGSAEISTVHANFFVNLGDAKATDVKALIDLAREAVRQKFGTELELEIELVGEW